MPAVRLRDAGRYESGTSSDECGAGIHFAAAPSPSAGDVGPVSHRLFVRSLRDNGGIAAHVTYFGDLGYCVRIALADEVRPFAIGHGVDPLTGRRESYDGWIGEIAAPGVATADEIYDAIEPAMHGIIPICLERGNDRLLTELFTDVVAECPGRAPTPKRMPSTESA